MGNGIRYKCSKCGKEYSAFTGVGFMFPEKYKEVQTAAKKGEYGSEWKDLVTSEKYNAVDAEKYLYVCSDCGHWVVEEGLSIYEPNDPETIAKKQYGEKTVEEWGEVPYAFSTDFKEDYHILKKRIHKCEKCGSVMHKASEEERYNLPCPYCGGECDEEQRSFVKWD